MSSQFPPARDAYLQPARLGRDARSTSSPNIASSNIRSTVNGFNPSGVQPGSFSTDLKSSHVPRNESRIELVKFRSHRGERNDDDYEEKNTSEQRQAEIREMIEKEMKIKVGSENLLEALSLKNAKQSKEQRMRVESELNISNRKIAQLQADLEDEIQRSKESSNRGGPGRLSQLFRNAPSHSSSRPALDDHEEEDGSSSESDTESPSFVLSEILQALEAEGLPSEYYVERSNNLVDLFKRHPTLKYDLAWSIFGLRLQVMLLNDTREVVAAAYRVMRYAITDRRSLSIMRSLHTDNLVMLSLVKESKASVEREQALKFVRAFLDVKEGALELSKAVVRVVVAIAENNDDPMRNISILTLAELLIRDPALVLAAGGMSCLSGALGDGTYEPAESLSAAFISLLDVPARRKLLNSGFELEGAFATFTDGAMQSQEARLKSSAKVIAALLRSWPGVMGLSRNNFMSIRSLLGSLQIPSSQGRDVVLDLISDVLRIRSPSWSSSFVAGRRLTTYGRVAFTQSGNVSTLSKPSSNDTSNREDLVEHFVAAILAVFVESSLFDCLLFVIHTESDPGVKRKATLLLGEALNLSHKLLSHTWSEKMQVLPTLFTSASLLHAEDRYISSNAIYQIDSVDRTLHRTARRLPRHDGDANVTSETSLRRTSDLTRGALSPQIDEAQFRAIIVETQVLDTVNFTKWRWDLIQKIIEGPLLNPKRLEEAMKANKFIKRLIGFYRPFKYRFADVRNNKPNQRYIRIGCLLVRTMLKNPEGVKYLVENKLLRQIAECLAQIDRLSGLTSSSPLFSVSRLSETLTGGYFAILGVLTSCSPGLAMLERWKMINMFYHIVELPDRDDLIQHLLGGMDYTIDSHMRIVLSKALTAGSSQIRTFATKLLRTYATRKHAKSDSADYDPAYPEWAIQLLVTQLYDPQVEVCEVAVKILEEACNQIESLEFVVRCRPALDHLGEIGAPLLLRFLSTSIGYHYLDELDYISQEMDDWFLGRNDTYVSLVEAVLAKALAGPYDPNRQAVDDVQDQHLSGAAPPHFYRELTRTAEGCKLLHEKGHFEEFVSAIRKHRAESQDAETILKVKGCLWAVANVGSMELGAPFLESTDVVDLLVGIAEQSEVMSMRGTAFFALGLISRSIHGQDMLAAAGWETTLDDAGQSMGICLPGHLSRIFKV